MTSEKREADAYMRRLIRYEAAPTVCKQERTREGEALDFYSPFGPMIARTRAPAVLLERINHYTDQTLAGRSGARLDHFSLPESFVLEGGDDSLASYTARLISQYLHFADDRDVSKVRFENFWMVRHFEGSFSPAHFHSGEMSGVLYLKLPESMVSDREEDRGSYISARRAGYITFLIGGKQQYSKSLISFKPEVGDFYVFPGWLLHAVEPFSGEGERRSMAFNAFVG